MKRKLIVVMIAIMSAAMAATPASAALRLYADANFAGNFANYSSTGTYNITGTWNDTLSSFKNELDYDAALYHDTNQSGSCFTAKRKSQAAWFAAWDDNKVSSLRIGAAC